MTNSFPASEDLELPIDPSVGLEHRGFAAGSRIEGRPGAGPAARNGAGA